MFFALPGFATGEIVYTDGDNLWLRQTINSNSILLLTAFEAKHPRWDPAKIYVYFSMYDSITEKNQIWKINSYFPEEIVKLTNTPTNKGFPVVSQDGTRIAYIRDGTEAGCDALVQGASDPDAIYIMDISGIDEGHPITCGFFQGLSWSHNGIKLVTRNKKSFHYISTDMNMKDDIYTILSDNGPLTEHGIVRITDTGDDDTETWADFSNTDPNMISYIHYNEYENNYNNYFSNRRFLLMCDISDPPCNGISEITNLNTVRDDTIMTYTTWNPSDTHVMTIVEYEGSSSYFLKAYETDDNIYSGEGTIYGQSYNPVIDPDWGYFERTQYPDLIINAIEFNKCGNGNCNPIAYVKNIGEITSPMPDVHFTINYNGETDICYVPGDFRVLEPGETAISFCLQNEYPYNEAGYEISTMVDPADLIKESVEANNNYQENNLNCNYPDLIVNEIRLINHGLYCQMEADVKNIGHTSSQINAPTRFDLVATNTITLTVDIMDCYSQNPPALDPNEEYTVVCDMIIPVSNITDWYSVTRADIGNVIPESNENNNYLATGNGMFCE